MKLTTNTISMIIIGTFFISSIHSDQLVFLSTPSYRADKNGNNDPIIITILYDNYMFVSGTQADWGYSCLIENTEKTILFDTGYNPDIFTKNVKELNRDLSQIDAVVSI